MKILLDLDDTLLDCAQQALDFLGLHNGLHTHIPACEMPVYAAWADQLSGYQWEMMEAIFQIPEFWREMKPLAGAVEFTQALKAQGHLCYIVTWRPWYRAILKDTMHCLDTHGFHYDAVFCTERREDKPEFAREEGLELAIEDSLYNAGLLAPTCPVLLLDRKNNRVSERRNDDRIVRCYGYEHLQQHIPHKPGLFACRQDGWPYCPSCDNDELWSALNLRPDGSMPTMAEGIVHGLSCYACSWSTRNVLPGRYTKSVRVY